LSAGAVVVIVVGVLAGLAATGGPTRPRATYGAFAGYDWFGRVTSVEASWRVPRILSGSPSGAAATWIGAQTPSSREAFIQIGVSEFDLVPAHQPQPSYFAFWSDTQRHFLDQPLFDVAPGDDVSASLTLAHRRWRLAIADRTSGAIAHFSTREEAKASFTQVEWLQEHVRGIFPQRLAYPQLTAITFRDLRVNSHEPLSTALEPVTMYEHGRERAPSSVRHDSFVLHRTTDRSTRRR